MRTSMKQLQSVTLSYNKEDKKLVHSCPAAVGQAGAACCTRLTRVLLTSPAASNAAEKEKLAFMIISIINGRWYRSGELWSLCFLWNFRLENFSGFCFAKRLITNSWHPCLHPVFPQKLVHANIYEPQMLMTHPNSGRPLQSLVTRTTVVSSVLQSGSHIWHGRDRSSHEKRQSPSVRHFC